MLACLYRKDRQIRSGRVNTLNIDWIGDDAEDGVTESLRDIGFLHVYVRQVGETLQRSPQRKALDKMTNPVNVLLAVASDACPGPGDAQ